MARRHSSRRSATWCGLLACALVLAMAAQAQAAPADFGGSFANTGRSTLIQPGGKVLVVGRSGNDFGLARYTADGALDKTFSGDGKLHTDFSKRADVARAVVVQTDGKILVAGNAGKDFALARYTADGTLDQSFSGDGKLTTDFAHRADSARAVSVRTDGRILVAGRSGKALALARYTAGGKLDLSFSHDGKLTSFIGGSDDGQSI